ncbi:hypothetical protein AURDEDRAFT_114690 [Auricularia subglabra TFB-10046 SS5]|nr:hypothetical protein AURDEDRAFT_114690 [Auricularia subglabra TFB-10046 SS5]
MASHPRALMHGGELNMRAWEECYAAVCKDLDALAKVSELEKPPAVRDGQGEG